MKKIILLFTVVIASIMFYHSFDILNYTQYAKIVSFPDAILNNNVAHVPIHINANKSGNDDILKALLNQAKEEGRAILYQAHPYSDTGYNQYHLYLYEPDNDIMETYYFENTKEAIDFSKDDSVRYYTSAEDINSYNKIRAYDSSYFIKEGSHVYIHPFIQSLGKSFEDEGISMMIYGDNVEQFINNVKANLTTSNVDFNWQDLSQDYEVGTYKEFESSKQNALILSLMTCFVALILAYFSLVMKDRKKITIYKMHGYRDVIIILKLYGILYGQMLITFVITYGFWILFKTQIQNELFFALYYQIMKQIIYMLFFIPVLLFTTKLYIRYTCNVLSLKGDHNLEKIMMMNYVMKVVLGIFLITPLINSVNDCVPLFKDYMLMRESEEAIRNNLYLKRPLSYKDIAFSNQLLKMGIYSDFDTYAIFSDKDNPFILNDDGLDENAYMAHPYIVSNENYLKKYRIEDEVGNPIQFENLKDNTLLVPSAYKENDLRAYMQGNISDIIYIANNDTMINESARSITHTLRNPIIRYVNTWNNSVINHCLHLPLTSEKNIDYYMEKAIESGVDLGNIAFGYTYADYDYYMVNAKQGFIELQSMILLYVFIFSLFLYQSIYLYVKKNQKQMAIEYIHGKSKIQRYGEIVIINICIYALIAIFSIILLHNSVHDTLLFVLFFEVFELILQYAFLRYYERQNISTILKGE